jgi:NitT/TauT family transport system substrate-binding protein
MKRRAVLAALTAALSLPASVRAQNAALDKLRIGLIPAEISAEIFYGIDRGIFARNGLDVEFDAFTNGNSIAAGLASGALDVGLSDLVSVMSAHVRGLPFGYIAPGLLNGEKAPTYGIIVAGNSAIRVAKDFNGTTFAVNGLKNIVQVSVQAWIDNNGGDSSTVRFVEMPIPAMAPAVARGEVQAAGPNEPALTLAVDNGARVIFMDRRAVAPQFLLSGWITTRAWVTAHPATARNFVRAVRETAVWANANRALSGPILAKYTKIPLPVIDHMHRGNFALSFDPAQIQPMIEAAAKYGVIDKSFPASDLIIDTP